MTDHTKAAELLHQACKVLSIRCDGAQSRDLQGFNKPDSSLGKALALHPAEAWNPAMTWSAYRMLQKYKKQLLYLGLDWSDIPTPPSADYPFHIRTIEADDVVHDYHVHLTYEDYHARTSLKKRVPGCRWNKNMKTWNVPHSSGLLLFEWAKEWKAGWTDTAKRILEIPIRTPEIINITEPAKVARLEGDDLLLKFEYDSNLIYDMKEFCKSIGIRRTWNPEDKTWLVHFTHPNHLFLLDWLAERGFPIPPEIADAISDRVEGNLEGSKAETSTLKLVPMGLTLRPFQIAGVDYILRNRRVLVADQMGLGKTIEALAAMEQITAFPALIITPSSVKYNWKKEANRLLPNRTCTVLDGGKAEASQLVDADIVIINYDIITKWRQVLMFHPWQTVCLDESHYIKNRKTQRAQTIIGKKENKGWVPGLMNTAQTLRILLTGTPVVNFPIDMVTQLIAIDRLKDMGGWTMFTQRYCNPIPNGWGGMDYRGASNLEELNTKLRASGSYLRREKEQVLKELPSFSRETVYLTINNQSTINRATLDLKKFLRETQSTEASKKAGRAEALVRISTLRQLTAKGKLDSAKEWVSDFLASGRKLVLFAWHKEIVSAMMETFAEFNPAKVDGSTSGVKRQQEVDRFQEDDNCRLIVCNIISAGEGITLTAASDVAFLEHAWNPAKEEQAEARIHRMGQTYPCTAWYLDASDTIDEAMRNLIEEKRQVVHAASIGTEEENTNNAMLDDLITLFLE